MPVQSPAWKSPSIDAAPTCCVPSTSNACEWSVAADGWRSTQDPAVPLQTLALSTIPMERLSNATSAFNVVRNFGGSVGIALATTLLARRSQAHQATLVSHTNIYAPETQHRLRDWTEHFLAQGADAFTAGRRAIAMVYRTTVGQAQVLAYIDVYWLLVVLFSGVLFLLPWLRRVRVDQTGPRPRKAEGEEARVEGLPAAASE